MLFLCAQVWDLRRLQRAEVTINTSDAVNRLSVSPNNKLIAAPLESPFVKIYSTAGVKATRLPLRKGRQRHRKMTTCTVWLSDEQVISAGLDGEVRDPG